MSWYGLDSASQAFWPEVRSATQTAAQNFSSEHPMFRRLSFPASSSCSNNLDGMNSPTPPQPYTVTTRSPRPCPKRSKVPRTGTLFPLFFPLPQRRHLTFPRPTPAIAPLYSSLPLFTCSGRGGRREAFTLGQHDEMPLRSSMALSVSTSGSVECNPSKDISHILLFVAAARFLTLNCRDVHRFTCAHNTCLGYL